MPRLFLLFVLVTSTPTGCGGSVPDGETVGPRSGTSAEQSRTRRATAASCADPAVSSPELLTSSELYLDVQGDIGRAIVRASFRDAVLSPEQLKLEIHRPDGTVHHQTFRHANYTMACPGCDPVVGGPPDQCQNVCSRQSVGPARPEVPHHVLNQYGEYVAVLHRPSTGATTTTRFTVGSDLPFANDPVCTGSPSEVAPYHRTGCGAGVVPVDLPTIFGATRVEYRKDECVASVYMRIAHVGGMRDHGTPQIFARSGLGSGREARYPEGAVHISERNGKTLVSWLGPRLVVVEVGRYGADEEALVRALLSTFPSLR